MNELITNLGVPVVVALLFIDRVIAILKTRFGHGGAQSSGDLSPAEWEAKIGKIVDAALTRTTERQIDMLVAALASLTSLNEKMAVLIDRTPRRGGGKHQTE